MALPPVYNLQLYQGDEYEFYIRLRLSDGSYEDLTGKIPSSQIKDAPGGTVVATWATTILPNGAENEDRGKIRMFLSGEQAALLPPGVSHYDVQLTNPDGSGRRTRVRGTITVTGEITTT